MIFLSLLANPVNIFTLRAPPTIINGTNAKSSKDIGQENIKEITIATPKFAMFRKKNPKRTPVAFFEKKVFLKKVFVSI